ncbi:C2 family cysteine protease [Amycolatopsis mongoliensis]|uniref:C2 family cysteine protease n=1 Tax=Amycolatopsis mongoliensis TaxID=715475 RepID=A0A9Y2JJB1_9PSEU|nr:C2 family cysteine protease [Amycolatopsis sp. 4-36]WIX98520.1 C2 family cysteine protease [Amycolatopsis sp. 4-36]
MTESMVGLANPYALAELALGRKVRWSAVLDHEAFVAKTLGVSIDRLCRPVPGNMLVSGAADVREALAETREAATGREKTFSSLARGPVEEMLTKISPAARSRIVGALAGGRRDDRPGYTPDGAEWADPGDFFEEAGEFFDPVQGGLGDCYFIAALSAVAWARPYVIANRPRVTGPQQQDFVDHIDFYSGGLKAIEVSERMPLVQGSHAWIYARSSEPGEIWPAVYEKAYAKWKTGDATDEPDYGPIAGGWPVIATTELTGLPGQTTTCGDVSADDIWATVRSHSLSCRTFNPMTAWTWCQTPTPVDYSDTGIYAYHAYTILGWAYVNGTKYIVLRNPWGDNGPVVDGLPGSWLAYDQSFWRNVPLNSGGVFAIPAGTFKKYYWQFGWAK